VRRKRPGRAWWSSCGEIWNDGLTLSAGSNVGAYRIIEPLGRGGMATVYKAYEPGLDRYVALKVLPPSFLHDETFAERFQREAKVIAKLEHPNIIPIHAHGIDDGVPWMAMRLIPGGTVHSLMAAGPLDKTQGVEILRGVANALDYAHEQGIVHRDIKPQNILLDAARHVYLADFGVARLMEGSTFVTREGAMTGTPQYMSPEQAEAKPVDRLCDIYAMGVVAYEMFMGRVPFQADTPMAVLMKHVFEPIPLPAQDIVPEPLSRAVLRALAKRKEDRWPTAGAFARAMEEALGIHTTGRMAAVSAAGPPAADKPSAAPPRRWLDRSWLGLAAVVGVAGFSWYAYHRGWTAGPRGTPPAVAPVATSPVATATVVVTPEPSAAASASPAARELAAVPPRTAKPGAVWTNPRDGLEYTWVPPADRFKMGCIPGDRECYPDEKPRHDVALRRGRWLGRTEVTAAAFRRFAEATSASMPSAPGFNAGWGAADHPIVNVNWAEAAAYCRWAGGHLPSEAEWEHAARGGKAGFKYPWGAKEPQCRPGARVSNGARFDDRGDCRESATQPVASYGPNGYGLFDVAGNAFEWCADWYGPRYYAASPKADPPGPGTGTERVLRGGSLNSRTRGLRVSLRNHMIPGTRSVFVGFRCALDPAER